MSTESLARVTADQDVQANGHARRRSTLDRDTGGRLAVRVIAGGDSAKRDLAPALRALPETATLRDVVEAVLGERPIGHGQTYANVVLTQRALARLAEAASGRAVAPWEPAP